MIASERVLGLDIGGANLKAATASGLADSMPFSLWREPENLWRRVAELIQRFPQPQVLAVTMTGELCDCFPDKVSGVRHIIAAVQQAAGMIPLAIWTLEARFRAPESVLQQPQSAAAANWLALAHLAAQWLAQSQPVQRDAGAVKNTLPGNDQPGTKHNRRWQLLLDIGSTTTDLIPIVDGKPAPRGRTDLQRLREGELIYLGVRRTPLCALLPLVSHAGRNFRPAAEWFADIQDAFLVLNLVPEQPDWNQTADSRPATTAYARARVARMLCAEPEELSDAALAEIAQQALTAWEREWRRVWQSWQQRFGQPPDSVLLSGEGEWWGDHLLQRCGYTGRVISLAQQLSPRLSQAACAYAVARLYADQADYR